MSQPHSTSSDPLRRLREATAQWWVSTLGNVGVTLLLAAPVAIYLNGLSRNVESVSSDLGKVRNELSDTQRQVRSLQEQAAASSESIASRTNTLFSADPTLEDIGAQQVLDLLEVACKLRLISVQGFRIEMSRGRYFIRFQHNLQSGSPRVGVERISGASEFEATLTCDNLAQVLAQVQEYCLNRGGVEFSVMHPIELLFQQLRKLRQQRTQSPDTIYDVQQLLPGRWFVSDDGVGHYDPSWDLATPELNKEDWLRHLRSHRWCDYDETDYALSTARALLIPDS